MVPRIRVRRDERPTVKGMVKSMRAGRRETLEPATIETLDAFVDLNDSLESARKKYERDLITKRPSGSITVKEFMAHYNARAAKIGGQQIAQRTAEGIFQKWYRTGEYGRAPLMIVSTDGKSRRTYVYWETRK